MDLGFSVRSPNIRLYHSHLTAEAAQLSTIFSFGKEKGKEKGVQPKSLVPFISRPLAIQSRQLPAFATAGPSTMTRKRNIRKNYMARKYLGLPLTSDSNGSTILSFGKEKEKNYMARKYPALPHFSDSSGSTLNYIWQENPDNQTERKRNII